MISPMTQTPFFSSKAHVSPYLADWHHAFAPHHETNGPLVELWFERPNKTPLREAMRLPAMPDITTLKRAALYLSGLLNNKLSLWGAKSAHIVADDAALAQELLHRVTECYLYKAELFSELTPFFLLSLIRKRYGENFRLDADADAVKQLILTGATDESPRPAATRPGRHTVLAINIGQHKTAYALVTLNGAGGYTISREHRLATWPEGQPRSYPDIAGQAMAAIAKELGPIPPDVEAVCCSLSCPVTEGTPYCIGYVGLCAAGDQENADAMQPAILAAAGEAFPGLPVFLINDAEAQGLYASRFCHQGNDPTDPGYATELLSIRFGACPSISYIDATGRNIPRLNEYAWLVTTVHGERPDMPLFSSISPYLSFYGIGTIARELGLLDKYGVEQNDAAACFHDFFTGSDRSRQRDAFKTYYVLGAHIAMLAGEVHRDTPVRHVQLLGSAANKLDEPVFTAIWNGFADFIDRHALPFDGVDFTMTEGVSAYASLVGAAVAYADDGTETAEENKRGLQRPGA